MVVPVLTEKSNIADLLKHEYLAGFGFCRDKVTVYNETGASITISNLLGQPIMTSGAHAGAFKFAVATAEASTKGLILSTNSLTLANGASVVLVALMRGPAILNDANIAALDVSGAALTLATIKTALLALFIKSNPEPTNYQTQTT